jgi:rare lipoprotein A
MGFGGIGRYRRFARLLVLAGGCLALANCSSGLSSKIDPRYGVTASPRVVELGEPVPKGGGVYRVGKPYVVGGRVYVPEENPNYSEVGLASFYGNDFHGRYTANGEIFDMDSISAAHPTMPLPSYARVTNLANRKSIVVRVNDRGPYARGRLIDVSTKTAKLLGFYGHGTARVKVDYVGRAPIAGSDDRKLMATLREGIPAPVAPVMVASAKDYAPTYFDSRSMVQVPSPPDRPYRLGEGEREVPALAAPGEPARIVAFAGATRPQMAEAEPEPAVSPVSAYAPVRYDGAASFNGRGLY